MTTAMSSAGRMMYKVGMDGSGRDDDAEKKRTSAAAKESSERFRQQFVDSAYRRKFD
jgi:hypothetical protein